MSGDPITTAAEADNVATSIVLALVDADPTAHGRCVLCDAQPPGSAETLTSGQHKPHCPWLRAVELEQAIADNWNPLE